MYAPAKPPNIDPNNLQQSTLDFAKYVEGELANIASALQAPDPNVLFVAPPKPRQGQIAYADGTHWNPGSGQGLYTYNGTSWDFDGPSTPTTIGGASGAITLGPELVINGQVLSTDPALIGEIKFFPFTTPPNSNYKLCDQSAISRATFATLFAHLVKSSTVTFTNASANITWTGHPFQSVNEPVKFFTTGSLPTNFTAGAHGTGGTIYYVKSIVNSNTITVAATPGGTVITAGSAGSGTQTAVNAPWGDGDGSTTFNLPGDLRGEFLRVWDAGRGLDIRGFGQDQLDAMQGHFHAVTANNATNNNSSAAGAGGSQTGTTTATITIGSPTTDGVNGTPRTAAETRPRNQALSAFIRVL